ncbi:hypothetical protein EV361DRAFT_1032048 [Lentinula raphanica]|nr:hypothetical protein F5880DRAFT_1504216 [Lentinula raphanica]KAJ3973967.1 hypothetical protein EV361DRAFT_1032048 [Lentinula raphanica]
MYARRQEFLSDCLSSSSRKVRIFFEKLRRASSDKPTGCILHAATTVISLLPPTRKSKELGLYMAAKYTQHNPPLRFVSLVLTNIGRQLSGIVNGEERLTNSFASGGITFLKSKSKAGGDPFFRIEGEGLNVIEVLVEPEFRQGILSATPGFWSEVLRVRVTSPGAVPSLVEMVKRERAEA